MGCGFEFSSSAALSLGKSLPLSGTVSSATTWESKCPIGCAEKPAGSWLVAGRASFSHCLPRARPCLPVSAGIAKACEQNLQKTLCFGGRVELPSSMELRAMLVSVGWGQEEREIGALQTPLLCFLLFVPSATILYCGNTI